MATTPGRRIENARTSDTFVNSLSFIVDDTAIHLKCATAVFCIFYSTNKKRLNRNAATIAQNQDQDKKLHLGKLKKPKLPFVVR